MLCLIASALPAEAGDKDLPDQAKAILDNASEFVVYSITPEKEAQADEATALLGHKVLGKTTEKEAETRKHLLAAMEKDITNAGFCISLCWAGFNSGLPARRGGVSKLEPTNAGTIQWGLGDR